MNTAADHAGSNSADTMDLLPQAKEAITSSKRGHYFLGEGSLTSYFRSVKELLFSRSRDHIHMTKKGDFDV